VFCVLSGPLAASDWTQYRGSNHDGIPTEIIRTDWAQTSPRRLWKVPLEPGLSSFSIGGGKAFTQVRRRLGNAEQEFCIALNTDTGQELWATPLGIAEYPNGGVGFDDGPRSTPTVDGNRVYVFSSYLKLACLDAATGAEIWSKDFVAEFDSTVVPWQNAASPVVVGDLIYVNSNSPDRRLMALHKEDGSIAWSGQNDRMTQATPIYANVAGVPQVIFFAQSGLVSVSPDTGAVHWRYAMPFSTSTAASPVVANDVVYCSAAYGVGSGAVRITRVWLALDRS
jgi:outer membrane protein assembly factor BamB